MTIFRADIPLFPPSINRLYIWSGRRRILSDAGRRFKAEFYQLLKAFDPPTYTADDGLCLRLWFFFPVVNAGWKTGKAGKYKRRDVSNLIKVVEDVVAAYLEIDDKQFLHLDVWKIEGVDRTCVEVSRISTTPTLPNFKHFSADDLGTLPAY